MKAGRGFETVLVNMATGFDGQGKTQYTSTATSIKARVVRETKFIQGPAGSTIAQDAVLWVDAGQPALPRQQDLVSLSGVLMIVMMRKDVMTLGGVLDHVRLVVSIAARGL